MRDLTALRDHDAIRREVTRILNLVKQGITYVGFDIETTGLNPRRNKLVSVAFKPEGRTPLIIDARDMPHALLRSLIRPLFYAPELVLVGHNLKFDLMWMHSIGIDSTTSGLYDTQLAELVILGFGLAEAKSTQTRVNLGAVAGRYGVSVSKEERNWFIGLDRRTEGWMYVDGTKTRCAKWEEGVSQEDINKVGLPVCTDEPLEPSVPWLEPFPQEQVEYMRQDVSVVHSVRNRQYPRIQELALSDVVVLENRVVRAVASMLWTGIPINTAKWQSIMSEIEVQVQTREARLHELFDVPILEDRQRKHEELSAPYIAWKQKREQDLLIYKERWQAVHPGEKGWGEAKKAFLAIWQEENPKPKVPTPLKEGVNLGSGDQIRAALSGYGITVPDIKKETLRGVVSDPSGVIQEYLDYKAYSHIYSLYKGDFIDKHAPGGILYPEWNQIGASTGRFSSSNPNFQQIPARGVGAELRKAFEALPGHVFLGVDFSNIELRVAAGLSNDPFMLSAFNEGRDLHAETAVIMFDLNSNREYRSAIRSGMSSKDWTDNNAVMVAGKEVAGTTYRSTAKIVNFATLYGGGVMRLAATLHTSVSTARPLFRAHRDTFKVALTWLREQGDRIESAESRATGKVYVTTVSGRRRVFDLPKLIIPTDATQEQVNEAKDEWKSKQARLRNQVGNAPIQGSSADILKLAMAIWMETYNDPNTMQLLAVVHDEFIIMVKNDPAIIARAREGLQDSMSRAYKHYINNVGPGKLDVKVSQYWDH